MWYNTITIWLLYSPFQGMFSGNTMVVHYTGRKSGKAYRVPISYLQVGNTLLTISYKRRKWWRNLRGGVDVILRLQGRDVTGRSEVIEEAQGVEKGIRANIASDPRTARMFGIPLGQDNQPEIERLRQAASERVIVRTTLK